MYKYFIMISLLIFSDLSLAKGKANKTKNKNAKTTAYSICSRSLRPENNLVISNSSSQRIIVAIETLSENQCKKVGRNKAEQYRRAGWNCVGRNNEELFSCESQRASEFSKFKGTKLDHLTFTNLKKHRSLIAYLEPNSLDVCHEDQEELRSAGVTDAYCHKR